MDDIWPQWVSQDTYHPHGSDDEGSGPQDGAKRKGEAQQLFDIEPVENPVKDEGVVSQLAVGNDVMAMIVQKPKGQGKGGGWVLFIYTSEFELHQSLDSTALDRKYDITAEPHRLHIDPTGQHVLLSLDNGLNFYANSRWERDGKPGKDGKQKDPPAKQCDLGGRATCVVVESVGWDKGNRRESSTGTIVLGDRRGALHLSRFDRKDVCRHYRHAFDLYKESQTKEREPVQAVEVEWFGSASKRLLVLAATPTRLYQFIGGPTLDDVFTIARERHADRLVQQLLPAPGAVVSPSFRASMSLARRSLSEPPHAVAWGAWLGVFHAKLDLSAPAGSGAPCIRNETVISFQGDHRALRSSFVGDGPTPAATFPLAQSHAPAEQRDLLGVAIGDYHLYLLYSNRLTVLAQPPGLAWLSATEPRDRIKPDDIKSRTVWEREYKSRRATGMVRDQGSGKLYVWTSVHMHEIQQVGDSKLAWRSFLQRAADPSEPDREEYLKTSLQLCPDAASRERVRVAAGDFYFERGDYVTAARVYCLTNKSFEETVLRLTQCGDPQALLIFLLCRVERIEARAFMRQESSQRAALCVWIVELFLDALNKQESDAEADALRGKLHAFLEKKMHLLEGNTNVIKDLIYAHGRPEETLHFASMTKDYKTVVTHYVNNERYDLALQCLGTHCKGPGYEDLWYQFSPQLIQHAPVQLVDLWRACNLKPALLIPAILNYRIDMNPPSVTEEERVHQGIRYLEWLIEKGNNEMALHNLLLTCYVQQGDEKELVSFLQKQCFQKEDEQELDEDRVCFDPKYALRLCCEHNLRRASTYVYSAMRLFDDAVQTALAIPDIELAKEQVGYHRGDGEQRKRLWMQVARAVVRTPDRGVADAIAMVKELRGGRHSDDLSVEDILPLFPDSVPIQEFRDELRAALDKYDEDITELMCKMEEKTEEAEGLGEEIKVEKQRSLVISAMQQCDACSEAGLASEGFYAFHCGHAFHQRCLAEPSGKARVPELPEDVQKRVRQAQTSIRAAQDDRDGDPDERQRRLHEARRELDDALGEQCPLCGIAMVEESQLPFISAAGEAGPEAQGWHL